MHTRTGLPLFLAAVVSALLSSPARAAVTSAGSHSINAHFGSTTPAVAVAAGGERFVVWSAVATDAGHRGVFGQRLSAAGLPVGGEIRLGDLAATRTRLSVMPGGGYLAAWLDTASHFQVRRLAADGHPLALAVDIPVTLGNGPSFAVLDFDLAALPAGGFAATWTSGSTPVSLTAQFLDASGAPVGSPLAVAQINNPRSAVHPRLAADPAGGFAVVWQAPGASGSSEIFARRFDAAGLAREALPIRVSAGTADDNLSPVVRYSPDGTFGIAWATCCTSTGVFAQRFSATGAPLGGRLQLDSSYGDDLDLTLDVRGTALLTWGAPTNLIVRITGLLVDAAWNPIGDAIPLGLLFGIENRAAVLVPGGVQMIWTAGSEGVFAQSFAADCLPGSPSLCAQRGRFEASVTWKDPRSGKTGAGTAVPLTDDTGSFWFFDPRNLELMVKVLDGRPLNGHFWVFYGGLSDLEYTVSVQDVTTGMTKDYHNPPFTLSSHTDTQAF